MHTTTCERRNIMKTIWSLLAVVSVVVPVSAVAESSESSDPQAASAKAATRAASTSNHLRCLVEGLEYVAFIVLLNLPGSVETALDASVNGVCWLGKEALNAGFSPAAGQ